MTQKTLDRWADWLVQGRDRGQTEAQLEKTRRVLRRFRDRVLRGGRLRPSQRVLDIGAGTGLIALGARQRVGAGGAVCALDVSADALEIFLREASEDPDGATVHAVAADGAQLPFADGSFDALFTRSVLIYLPAKAAAILEMHRVLRPGGRASLFEPINSVGKAYQSSMRRPELSALQPEADQIKEYVQRAWGNRQDVMLDFDERDLVRWFVEAGFSSVGLKYDLGYGQSRTSVRQALQSMLARPNPHAPSYEEAARKVLGDAADGYLRRHARLIARQGVWNIGASAYLTARK